MGNPDVVVLKGRTPPLGPPMLRHASDARTILGVCEVLLVDDEERMVAALRRGLTAEGLVVESATDGPAGLRLTQHGDFDAGSARRHAPRGSPDMRSYVGYGPAKTGCRVLMLSAKDGEYDQADGLDDGADDYLTKPFPSSYCWLASERCCVAAPGLGQLSSAQGTWNLDPASREVRVNLSTR